MTLLLVQRIIKSPPRNMLSLVRALRLRAVEADYFPKYGKSSARKWNCHVHSCVIRVVVGKTPKRVKAKPWRS